MLSTLLRLCLFQKGAKKNEVIMMTATESSDENEGKTGETGRLSKWETGSTKRDKKETARFLVRMRTILTDLPPWSARLVPTVAGRRCWVVHATNPYGR
jgi:hypothetical protein